MAGNCSSIAAIPICLESGFMCCSVFQCIVVNIRFLVAVFKEWFPSVLSRVSYPKKSCTVYRFFSDLLKCEDYCCTLYRLKSHK